MNTTNIIFFIILIGILAYTGVQLRSRIPPPLWLGDHAYSSLILLVAFALFVYMITKTNCEMFKLPSKSHKHKNKK